MLRVDNARTFCYCSPNLKPEVYMDKLSMCNCYVKGLSTEAQFTLHWGAHAYSCPAYSPSRDPVDKIHDEEIRAAYLAGEVSRE